MIPEHEKIAKFQKWYTGASIEGTGSPYKDVKKVIEVMTGLDPLMVQSLQNALEYYFAGAYCAGYNAGEN